MPAISDSSSDGISRRKVFATGPQLLRLAAWRDVEKLLCRRAVAAVCLCSLGPVLTAAAAN